MIAAGIFAAAVCGWNFPGADPTTSAVPATLAAMGIDSHELAAKIEAGDYDERVTIHRNDRRPYGMSSGNARWCSGEVDTSAWAADHEEQGRVYRVGDLAVVWYWRCHNLSIWTAPRVASLPEPAYMDGPIIESGPIGNGPGHAALLPLASQIVEGAGGYAGGSWGVAAGFGYAAAFAQPCDCVAVPACPVAAVPESEAVWLIGAGLAAIWLRRRA